MMVKERRLFASGKKRDPFRGWKDRRSVLCMAAAGNDGRPSSVVLEKTLLLVVLRIGVGKECLYASARFLAAQSAA